MRIARLIGIAIFALVAGVGLWWFFVRTATPNTADLAPVRQETLDTSLLRDQLYTRLRPPRQVPTAQVRGRANPFAAPVTAPPEAPRLPSLDQPEAPAP